LNNTISTKRVSKRIIGERIRPSTRTEANHPHMKNGKSQYAKSCRHCTGAWSKSY